MKLRAVIFDIYRTVLDVGAAPADAAARWSTLWRDLLGRSPRMSLAEFATACEGVVAREHAAARSVGVEYPEIYWPDVVAGIVPELAVLPETTRADFMYRQTGLWHTTRLMPGAADVLRQARECGLLLGIASNAQPYTLRELAEALESGGLSAEIFSPDLCFWSFAHGFSKPDPHVFRLLTARLRARGVAAAQTLMVGDRLDNDVVPASAQGWRTWQLTTAGAECGGDWAGLKDYLTAEPSA